MEVFDYRNETFWLPPCDELVCGICHCVFFDPMQGPCQHVFCKNCIEWWLQDHGTCPECRESINTSSLTNTCRLVRNIILNLKVWCRNRNQGCQEICSLDGYEVHLKACPYQIIKCTNGNCDAEMVLKDKKKHEDVECLFYDANCTLCKKTGVRHEMLDHDCLGAFTSELDAIKKRLAELENEKKLLQCQIVEMNSTYLKLHEEITQALCEVEELRRQKHSKHTEEDGYL